MGVVIHGSVHRIGYNLTTPGNRFVNKLSLILGVEITGIAVILGEALPV